MRAILIVLLALLVPACGSSSSSTKTGSSAQAGSKPKVKKVKKKKPPFEPAALASLPDLGELRTSQLASLGSSLKKICPAKKKGKGGPGGCACLPVGEATGSEVWEDNVGSCSTASEGVKAPLENVQLLAAQEAPRKKPVTASFKLAFQTRKGWFSAELGTAEHQEGSGYSRTLKLVSRSFVEFGATGPGVLVTYEDRAAAAPAAPEAEGGAGGEAAPAGEAAGEAAAGNGFAIACVAVDAKKVGCTEPLALGGPRKKGGYQLEALVEEGSLSLRETGASTPDDIKSRAGKYALTAP